MAVGDGKIQFEYEDDASATQTLDVDMPLFSYRTVIKLPFEIVKLENGSGYSLYDNGTSYDIRECLCTLELSATERNSFDDMIRTETKQRGKPVTIRMNTGSGFFPFGADKGDGGDFITALIIISSKGIGEAPYKYFHVDIKLVNTGSWPVYSIPTEISDQGNLTIGTITNVRFPPNWFEPKLTYGISTVEEQDSSVQIMDKGTGADEYETMMKLITNETKCAKVVEYLVDTARVSNFNLIAASDYYPFGRNLGGSGTFVVKLIQDKIVITHARFDEFRFSLLVSYVSGP